MAEPKSSSYMNTESQGNCVEMGAAAKNIISLVSFFINTDKLLLILL